MNRHIQLVIGKMKFQVEVEGIKVLISYTDLKKIFDSYNVPCEPIEVKKQK